MKRWHVAITVALIGCKVQDPPYCEENTPCTEMDRSYCDVRGEFPASGGVGRTCIADPFDDQEQDGSVDSDAPPGIDAGAADAGACRWSRLSRLANLGDGGGIGSVNAEGTTIYFHRDGSFWRATRDSPTQPFREPVQLDFDAEGLNEPEVSSTGLELFFRVVDGDVIARATRPTLDAAFIGREPTGLTGQGASLSGDGLSMYFVSRQLYVQRATRTAIGEPWSEPDTILATGDHFSLDVSPDGLRLLVVENPFSLPVHPVLVSERQSLDEAFQPAVPVDPDILLPDQATYTLARWNAAGDLIIASVSVGSETHLYYAACE